MNVKEKTLVAGKAFHAMSSLSTEDKNNALLEVAKTLEENRAKILEANQKDVSTAESSELKLSNALLARLKLTESKIDGMIKSVESVMELEDPVGKTLESRELDKKLILRKVSVPIGVIGFIFESRPDVVPQIASLCLKSGNSVVMKGGSEAIETNRVLYELIKEASSKASIPNGWIQLVETRDDIKELLKLNESVDLVIPRGSNKLVKHIQKNTNIPVMGHSDGICHAYVDRKADLEKAVKVCFDAKVQYPAVCNAIETLLVDENIAVEFLPKIAGKYLLAGVELRVDDKAGKILSGVKAKKAKKEDWSTEYNDLVISIKIVSNVDEAIEHINTYGSKHTDVIITEDKETARKFLTQVDSSSVMHNCSTRFADGYRYGLGAEVGISTSKYHARGPVGLEGLTTYKYILEGNGQVVKDYVGDNAKEFTHKKL